MGRRIGMGRKRIHEKVRFTCEHCGKQVERYYNPNNGDRFCSTACVNAWRKVHPEENYFHKFPRVGELNGNWGRHPNHRRAVDMRKLSKLGRLAQGPQKTTKPEQRLYDLLEQWGVGFEAQKYIGSYCVDAFVPPNIIIEVDGEYWHNHPHGKPTDAKRDLELEGKGYKVCRYWANEIMNKGQEALKWLVK